MNTYYKIDKFGIIIKKISVIEAQKLRLNEKLVVKDDFIKYDIWNINPFAINYKKKLKIKN